MTSSHHGPYDQGYTRATMAHTKRSDLARASGPHKVRRSPDWSLQLDSMKSEPRIDRDEENKPIRVWLSAQTGAGIPQLFQALTERLSGEVAQHTLRLPPQEGRLRSRFYQLQAIEKEWMEEDGSVSLQVRMPIVDWRRLCKQEPALIDYLI